ncbi:DEAD/DEAH box helicase [Nordella sp. HKS 07]|uniref:DEAD/DEAH box helicase n=1 Tax=Nordella sp. HKS 07 TaxID=2712222 RepID=UPI0013E15C02|nr:DEAD/DEAH box helicase [Nordella sp. HKS 07]QIG50778.1 DEAD/DEAH box helicase [Nordella sp. HKS 07]
MQFSELGLSPKVLEAVEKAGFATPTPIQAGAIPPALARKDVLGLAQTGSGKTAAFVLPMLSLLESGRARARIPRTLILEPTRELAAQVQEAFERIGQQHRLTVALLIGGVSFDDQAAKIDRGADVVIATPGRLLDHFERGKLLLTGVEMLVIDEADRMLDMGFIPDIERIYKLLPFTRQTLFFSATMPPEIQRITNQFLHAPVRVEVSPHSSTAATIEQKLVKAPSEAKAKREALRRLLKSQTSVKNAIVFANRKTTVGILEASLKRHGFNAAALHGDMDQRARLRTLESFRGGEITFLIASDVAARGLDIPDVSHVFNFDVPIHAEDYVHRVGRTGRAGREGHAFMLATKAEAKYVKAIEQLIRQSIPWDGNAAPAEADHEDGADTPREERPRRRRGGKPAGERPPAEAKPAREEKPRAAKPTREEKPREEKPREERPLEDRPREAKPRHEPRQPRRKEGSRDRRPSPSGDVPDSDGFHSGNMPAFLLRPVRSA